MFFTFKICQVCDRRFLTDTGFDSHLTKHSNGTGQSPPAELKPDPGSQDLDVNPEPPKDGHQPRAEADGQGEKGPTPAGIGTRQKPTVGSNSSNLSAEELIPDPLLARHQKQTRAAKIGAKATTTGPGIVLQDSHITSSTETTEPEDSAGKGPAEVRRRPKPGNPESDQTNEREAVDDSGFASLNGSRFKCRSCKKDFSSRSLLKDHTNGNCKVKKKLKCKFCRATFDLNIRLACHVRLVHGKKLGSPNQDLSRTRNRDEAGAGWPTLSGQHKLVCLACNKSFDKIFDFKLHNVRAHGTSELEECNKCQKYFLTKLALDLHDRNVHLGIKSFQCHLCPKKYSMNQGLLRHISSFHQKLRPFKCKICDVTFTQKAVMTSHVKKRHEKKVPKGTANV